jgi:hypothetical protein
MAKDKTTRPDYPTTTMSRLPDGRLIGTDNSVWVVRAVPMAPVVDASSPQEALAAAEPIIAACEEMAAMTSVRIARRSTARGSYRQIHVLLVNIPRRYVPPAEHPIASYLAASFPNVSVDRRLLLFAVKLNDKIGGTGGLRQAVDSVTETLVSGTTPLSDYDKDFAAVDSALSRAGLTTPSPEEFRLANSWWNHGNFPDTPYLEHSDHLHVFTTAEAARVASDSGAADCAEWPVIAGHHALTFAAVQDFDLPYISPSSSGAWWVSQLLAAGAAVVSIRAKVEPAKVTRAELRRRRKQYMDDINERLQEGKMERSEQEETLQQITDIEALYAAGATPSLVDASTLVVFDGKVGEVNDVTGQSNVVLNSMLTRQRAAMYETMLCSPLRANPHLHDLPIQTVACSGLPSLSVVGDPTGALLGFTERDRQPAYVSPTAAATADGLPMGLVVGQTGSGKAVQLSTTLQTLSGTTTMGEIKLGDEVIGRDGEPCRVLHVSPTIELPDLYDIRFDDGQIIKADADHQWVVSTHWDRNGVKHPSRTDAVGVYDRVQQVVAGLSVLADTADTDATSTVAELGVLVATAFPDQLWATADSIRAMLEALDAPWVQVPRHYGRSFTAKSVTKTDPVVLYPLRDLLQANLSSWRSVTGVNATRWRTQLDAKIAAATIVLADWDGAGEPGEGTAPDLVRLLTAAGSGPVKPGSLREIGAQAGVTRRKGHAVVTVPLPEIGSGVRMMNGYNTAVALKTLAARLTHRYPSRPMTETGERVMTTLEMLSEGIRIGKAQRSRFAIRLTRPFEPTIAPELPLDPYVLGAWLGDGSSWDATITQGAVESCTDEFGLTDQAHLMAQLAEFDPRLGTDIRQQTVRTRGLRTRLRLLGLLEDKHIPTTYARASYAQRLALLQGLMDTDGHIAPDGGCELTLCRYSLALGALDLIRSLGIKADMNSSPAMITEADPDNPGQTRRRETSTRYRVLFTTTQPVFLLPRKARRIPTTVRDTQNWLYITDVVATEPAPARCIQVDSSDSTYLAGGWIPTHNTVLLLDLADQFARIKTDTGLRSPVVIIDPKALALDTPVPTPAGWSTIADINPGDRVFGRDGAPCEVTAVSRLFTDTDMFDVVFSDGQMVRADAHHQWVVADEDIRSRLADHHRVLALAAVCPDTTVATPGELLGTLARYGVLRWTLPELEAVLARAGVGSDGGVLPASLLLKACASDLAEPAGVRTMTTRELITAGVATSGGCPQFSIPVAQSFVMPVAVLPEDPYVVGNRVDGAARIPEEYLWASVGQRRSLLRGIMDCAGTGHEGAELGAIAAAAGSARARMVNEFMTQRLGLFHRCAGALISRHAVAPDFRGDIEQIVAETALEMVSEMGTSTALRGDWEDRLYTRCQGNAHAFLDSHASTPTTRNKRATLSRDQRRALRREGMDPVGNTESVGFSVTVPSGALVGDILLLIRGLGFTAVTPPAETSAATTIAFSEQAPFITDIRPVPSQPAKCLRVDSSDHTYLVQQFVPTHNTGSDHSGAVLSSGGQVVSLDDLASADGVFDPIRFTKRAEVGVELASSLLLSINPWGTYKQDYEAPLIRSLSFGVEHGGTCIGEALTIALKHNIAPENMVKQVLDLAESSAMFAACVGVNPGSDALSIAEGITLIKVGDAHLDLPQPGQVAESIGQRTAMALVRMMVFGTAMALTGREGVILMDEFWVFLGAGRSEVERLGRLARSQGVLPIGFTQRVTDAIDAGLTGYISRGWIGPIADEKEAMAACELFKIEPTRERLARITAKASIGGTASGSGAAPNWRSMRALIDPLSRKVLRGAIFIYIDLDGRSVPVEVTIPEELMIKASTNPEDIRRRVRAARKLEEDASAEVQPLFDEAAEPVRG